MPSGINRDLQLTVNRLSGRSAEYRLSEFAYGTQKSIAAKYPVAKWYDNDGENMSDGKLVTAIIYCLRHKYRCNQRRI